MSTRRSICPICRMFASSTYGRVLRHIGEVHSFSPGFRIDCGLGPNKCPATYTKYSSFRSHVYKKHREELHHSDSGPEQVGITNANDGPENSLSGLDQDEGRNEIMPLDYDEQLTRAAALFILKTTEIHKTSQVYSIYIYIYNTLVF